MNSHHQSLYSRVRALRRALAVTALLLLATVSVCAQRATGTISGRVVTEDGQPIAHATVTIVGASGARRVMSARNSLVTDEDGNFQAEGLDPMPYTLFARAPGYALAQTNQGRDAAGNNQVRYSFVGETVTITMTRGGVITGRVTNALGEPVIGIPISAVRVRDEAGQPLASSVGTGSFNRQTDDRGIYRLYGLLPGIYIVVAGTSGLGFSPRATPYDGRMRIYHPSATRDTAAEVTVRSGDETSGVDIRYRSERGFAISGKVTGAPAHNPTDRMITTTGLTLRHAATGVIVATSYVPPGNEQQSYALYGVPNGEYEIVASRQERDADALTAAPRRVTINGRDVTGIDLALAPTATIAGAVVVEKPVPSTANQKCAAERPRYVDEIILHARIDDASDKENMLASFARAPGVPSEKGDFTVRNLKGGRYRLAAELPAENWYVKAIKQTVAAGVYDVARQGLTLKTGERSTGVQLTIAPGAASLQGKVVAAEGASLPRRVRVYLLPAEAEAKDDLLRFAEVRAESDGAFRFGHRAPGKYLLLARAIPDSEPSDRPARPAAWDLAERAKLRKEAEAPNVIVELQSCQRTTDFALRFGK